MLDVLLEYYLLQTFIYIISELLFSAPHHLDLFRPTLGSAMDVKVWFQVWYPCGCCSRLLWDIVSLWMHDYLMADRGVKRCNSVFILQSSLGLVNWYIWYPLTGTLCSPIKMDSRTVKIAESPQNEMTIDRAPNKRRHISANTMASNTPPQEYDIGLIALSSRSTNSILVSSSVRKWYICKQVGKF